MESSQYRPEFDLKAAHTYSSCHRKQIEESNICGCFYCLSTFQPSAIEEWVDEDKDGINQTAICPMCGVDSVLGSKAGYPLTAEFLGLMRIRWFES